MRKNTLNMVVLTVLVSSCAPKKLETNNDVFDPTTATIESATSLISGLADDQVGSSYAVNSSKNWKQDLLISQAVASNCVRAVYNSCQSGVKSETYMSCNPGLTYATMTGSVNLNYSNSTCDMNAVGSSVTRTYNLALYGPHGGEVDITSSTNTDYNGHSYGGGGRLTVTPAGWNMDILGKHKVLIYKGKTLYNVSIRTTAPLAITGSLSRASRVVNSGQLEVNHNIAGFTALITPSNLQWSNSCCHPISGSLNITWSGSKTGTAVVNFQSCGQAQVDENGQTQDIELSYCE